MILTIAAVVVSQAFLIRISDCQDGVAGEVEERIEIKDDGTWVRSVVRLGGKSVPRVSGKLPESGFTKVKTAVKTLALSGDESYGDPDFINEHRAIIASGEGRIFIRGLHPIIRGTLAECLRDESRLLGPRVKAAAEFVEAVEPLTK